MTLVAFLLLLLPGCGEIDAFNDPIPPRDPWVRRAPAADVLARIEAARDYSQAHGGRSLLVLEGDAVVFEDYYGGHSAETPWPMWSATKTFACLMAVQAVDEGWLALDERAAETLTEWQHVPDKEDITVEHLLRFTSGLRPAFGRLSLDGFKPIPKQRVADKYSLAISRPSTQPPGEAWVYGSVHLAAFGALMERKLGESPLVWLEREVLDPLGFRTSGWSHDPDGNPMLAYGAWTSTPELAKLGALLRDDGVWQGQRLLPEGTLQACMAPTPANPAYGLAAWRNGELGAGVRFRAGGLLPHGEGTVLGIDPDIEVLFAAGARGQRIYVIPSLDWVVVHQCDSKEWEDPAFMALLLGDTRDGI